MFFMQIEYFFFDKDDIWLREKYEKVFYDFCEKYLGEIGILSKVCIVLGIKN